MKVIKSMGIALFAILLMVGIIACGQQNGTVNPSNTTQPELSIPDLPPVVASGITDATMDKEMTLQPVSYIVDSYGEAMFCPPKVPLPPKKGDTTKPGPNAVDTSKPAVGTTPPVGIFGKLNLTKDQATQIQAFDKAYMTCLQNWMQQLFASEKTILATANTARLAILADAKAGTIDKKTAAAELIALNAKTNAALKANPFLVQYAAGIIKCRDDFFASVRGILTATQQVIWDKWDSQFKAASTAVPKP